MQYSKRSAVVGSLLAVVLLVGGLAVVANDTSAKTAKTKCLNGEVVSMSKKTLTVKIGAKKYKNIRISSAQFSAAGNRSIRKGSPVKVCSKDNFKTALGNLVNRAPKGQEATYGNVDGGGGGGGGNSGT